MTQPLINAARTRQRLKSGKDITPSDLVATMYQAFRLTKDNNPAANHRMQALSVALSDPQGITTITNAPDTFDRIADICDTAGAELFDGNPDSPWADLARIIRERLPSQGYGVTKSKLRDLDRHGQYGILFHLQTGQAVAEGPGGILALTLEKTPVKDTLALLEVSPAEARTLVNDPKALRTAFRKQMARRENPPMAELAAYYPQLAFGLTKDNHLIARLKNDPTTTAEELKWDPSDPKKQHANFYAIERLNLSARRHTSTVRIYMEQVVEQARLMEIDLFLKDKNEVDRLKSLYGPAAATLDPGRPTVKPIFPSTNQGWAKLAEEIETSKLGTPQFQTFEIFYPNRGPVRITWNNHGTPDERALALQKVNLPRTLLEERVGRNTADLPVEEIQHRLDPHKNPERTPPPPPVQERNHFKDLKKTLELERQRDRDIIPDHDAPVR